MCDFGKFNEWARAGERLSVAFIGGSLTWGANASDPQLTSYRALVGQWLEELYPEAHFRFWDAAVGGTSSNLAAFRLQRDVLARKPDLVFIDFTINDHPYDVDEEKLASYESLTRRVLLEAGAPVLLVILAVRPDLEPARREPRPRDAKHKEVGAAYNTPVADAVAYMDAEVKKGRYTPEEMWPDNDTHPQDKGYLLYAEAVMEAYKDAVARKQVCRVPEKMVFADTYMTWKRQRVSQLGKLPAGWTVGTPSTTGCAFDFYMSRWMDDVTTATAGAEALRVKIKAKTVMFFGELTPKCGKFFVKIDGKPANSRDIKDGLYDPAPRRATANMHLVLVLAQDLDPTVTHTLEIIPQLEHVTPAAINGKADPEYDQVIRVESLCIAGGAAEIEIDG